VDVNDIIQRFADNESVGEGGKSSFAEEVLANLPDAEALECPICLDVMETPMIIPECMHQWYWLTVLSLHMNTDATSCSCKDCILAHLATCEERREEQRCPICSHGPIKVRLLLP